MKLKKKSTFANYHSPKGQRITNQEYITAYNHTLQQSKKSFYKLQFFLWLLRKETHRSWWEGLFALKGGGDYIFKNKYQ